MKTLEQIADEVSKEYGHDSIHAAVLNASSKGAVYLIMKEASEIHTVQMCEKQREICGDNAEAEIERQDEYETEIRITGVYDAPLATSLNHGE